MKKNIGILIFTFLVFISYASAEDKKDDILNYYLSENFKIISSNENIPYNGYIYFVLEKKISDGFRKLETGIERSKITEIVVCRVPVTNFDDKTVCKKP